ncbi:ABC transporter permease [Cypionkella aquatica]|uniref:ABC transporter permease n=1 Tax=Cypionkella aquatica TaxID=1756042 RepID=A0AA37X041_9RHOB|nr:AI-2E family transporter [Cypionkella aquatica]GLS85280.1 ABC transporter permease [Cypionkella aquatica]
MPGYELTPLPQQPGGGARITMAQLATVVAVAAVLFVAQDVFVPLAIAMLITFALSPLVTALRRRGLPLLWTVLLVVALAFSAIALFSFIVAGQLAQLAQNLPIFQANIIAKVESLKATGGDNGLVAKLSDMITAINSEIGAALPTGVDKPMPVEVIQSSNALAFLENLVLPLISPIATVGLVIVVVIFMLLEREDLRDRFIRLVGTNDLYRTTQVLEEAGSRVANYLLVQLLVNTIYAVPIGIGLYFIGVPNAALWGMLTLILRFVPYIGSVLAAAFPLFLAFAVSPDWSALLWTAALFASVELITSNVIEPWLYGARTGVSPLAIIVAAIFWTFLWGPLGLILSTPLTVCLVVLGRHIPQFALFDILFGDEPVLAPHAKLYQRMLAGDAVEATFGATEAMEELDIVDYYQTTMIPALLLAQDDSERGVLTPAQQDRLAMVAMQVVNDLEAEVEAERAAPTETALPGLGIRIGVIGGRTSIDDVAAAVLGQSLHAEGAAVQSYPHTDLSPTRLAALDTDSTDCLLLCYLDPRPTRASLLHIRRIKRAAPHLRVGVVILQMPSDLPSEASGVRHLQIVQTAKLAEAEDLGADFAVTSLESAMDAAWLRDPAKPLPAMKKPQPRVVARRRSKTPNLIPQA